MGKLTQNFIGGSYPTANLVGCIDGVHHLSAEVETVFVLGVLAILSAQGSEIRHWGGILPVETHRKGGGRDNLVK
jgi:hypothetical protein